VHGVNIPDSIHRNNSEDYIAVGFTDVRIYFYKVSSYNKNLINNPNGVMELSGGKKAKSKSGVIELSGGKKTKTKSKAIELLGGKKAKSKK